MIKKIVYTYYIYIYYIPPLLTVHFSMTRSVRYQPIFNTLYYTLHTEHAYCLSYRFLNNVVITTVIEMVELVEILDRRLGKRSVERVRYVINNLLHLVIVKYGDISLVLCISTRLRLVTILSLLVKYLVIFHADPCNKSYIIQSEIFISFIYLFSYPGNYPFGVYEIDVRQLSRGPHLFILSVDDGFGRTLMKVYPFSLGMGELGTACVVLVASLSDTITRV